MHDYQSLFGALLILLTVACTMPARAQTPADEPLVEPPQALTPAEAETAPSQADYDADLFPELKYYQAPSLFICPVHLPADYDPVRSYPLVIGLHGYASSPELYHTLYYAFDDPQFIYAAPQAPYPLPMGTSLGYSWFLNDQDGNLLEESKLLAEQYVLDMVAQLSLDYSVSEIYLLGFSQGGALAYITGIGHPAAIKGIVCFDSPFELSWFEQPELIENATGLRVFIAHATDDPAVEYQKGVEAAAQLEQQGFNVRFLQFEGGHTLTAAALKEAEAWIENPPED